MENSGKYWSYVEDKQLVLEVRNNKSLEEISSIHKRTVGAITSRINHIARNLFQDGKTKEEIATMLNLTPECINNLQTIEKKTIINRNKVSKDNLILKELVEIKNLLKSIDDKLNHDNKLKNESN
jgi:hypothetical protein